MTWSGNLTEMVLGEFEGLDDQQRAAAEAALLARRERRKASRKAEARDRRARLARARGEAGAQLRTCPVCGGTFYVTPRGGRPQVYDSPKCRREAYEATRM